MAEKQLKKCSTSLAIWEMQIKMTLRFHLTLARMAKINNTSDSYADEDVEQREHSSIAAGSANSYSHCGNQYDSSSENWESVYLRTQLYHFLAYIQRTPQGCSTVFIAALFIIVGNWKQPTCPSTKERIQNVIHL